ncbi:MAG: hypothetical protein CL677_04350 [Bdellovibrionaceae bacterium]|nr:hypothetical protein [Pseudobdellovibrionaceae bacterium]
MQVLHIGLEKSWRGGENQIFLLIKGLEDRGVKSHVAYPQQSRGYQRFGDIVSTLGLPSTSGYDFRSIRMICEYVSDHKIDVIDAHSSGAHSLGLAVKLLMPQVRLVVHRRVDNEIKPRFLTKKKYLSPQVDRFVPISDCIRRMLIAYGVSEQKISVVKSAVDPDKYDGFDRAVCRKNLLAELKMNDPGFLIGNASAFTHQKGYDVLIQSLKPLNDKGLTFHCLLAGDGELLGEMKQLAKNLSLEKKITFLGFRKDIPEFLSALDVLVMPSNNEGLGTLILDAISAGCGVVATRVGGIPEMVINGETGLTVSKGHHKELARAIETLAKDRELLKVLSENAKAYVRNNFSLNSMVEGNLKVYKSF